MIPYMTIRQRIIAWLLWRLERFDSMENAEFDILYSPQALRCVSLLSDYWYIKNAKESGDD